MTMFLFRQDVLDAHQGQCLPVYRRLDPGHGRHWFSSLSDGVRAARLTCRRAGGFEADLAMAGAVLEGGRIRVQVDAGRQSVLNEIEFDVLRLHGYVDVDTGAFHAVNQCDLAKNHLFGMETSSLVAVDDRPGTYFVSGRFGERNKAVLGPFDSHLRALLSIGLAKTRLVEGRLIDAQSQMILGTSRLEPGAVLLPATLLGAAPDRGVGERSRAGSRETAEA